MSTRQLSDGSGQVIDTYTYDAFGLLLNRTGATENNYLYTGEQYDPNCGFYYLRARYYNASVGRFLTMDTWKGSVFEPYSLHKYLYCEGNPVGRWDPSGKFGLFGGFTLQNIVYGAIIGGILGGASYTIGFYLQPIEEREWDNLDFINSIVLGSVGGVIGAAYGAVIISVTSNAILSGLQYWLHCLHTTDDFTAMGAFLSIGIGAFAGFVSGRLSSTTLGSIMRGFWASYAGTAVEVSMVGFINSSISFVDQNVSSPIKIAVKKILYEIFGGDPKMPGPINDPINVILN